MKENLDQHFMIDNELINRIVDYAELNKNDVVLEIGPGKGALTKKLIEKCFVIAIELDKELYNQLVEMFEGKNIRITQGNALKKLSELEFNKIVSNIPYSISEPLLIKILIKQPELVVLTTGKKFIDYINNNELLKTIYDFEIKEIVQRTSFTPPPNTDSAVIKFQLKQDVTAKLFKSLLNQHDKKLKNALINIMHGKFTKRQVKEKIKNLESKNKSILNIQNKEIELIKTLFV